MSLLRSGRLDKDRLLSKCRGHSSAARLLNVHGRLVESAQRGRVFSSPEERGDLDGGALA